VLPAFWDGGGDRYHRGRDTSVTHSPGASGRIAFRGGEPGDIVLLPVAAEAVTIAFGVVLAGDGVLWADDLSFEAVPD
jgi:hypothetical protein